MTTTASPAVVCPSWCTTSPEEHAKDVADPNDGATFHRSETIDAWQMLNQYPNQVSTWEDTTTGRTDTTVDIDGDLSRGSEDFSELDSANARRLAAALIDAADMIEQPPPKRTVSEETLTHFWVCTSEGRPFLSRLLCDAGAQRPNDGSRMKSSWEGVTCPECLAAGPAAADAIKALPDTALVVLGAWPVPSQAEADTETVTNLSDHQPTL